MYKNEGKYDNPLQIPNLATELGKLVNLELKYSEICSLLNMKPKYGDSKKKQITDLSLFCVMDEIQTPVTKYIIQEVYDKTMIKRIDGRNKFQIPIEGLILTLLEQNDYKPIYLKRSEMISALSLVNDNYSFICNNKLRNKLEIATGEDYSIVADGSRKAGNILWKWADRCLEIMRKNGLIIYEDTFILYKEIKSENFTYISRYNVPSGSEDRRRCFDCFNKARDAIGVPVKHRNKEGDITSESLWIPDNLWDSFFNVFNSKIKEEFNGEYISCQKAKSIETGKWTGRKALEIYRSQLNAEAQRKIKNSKQLNFMTGFDRDKLVDEIITYPPEKLYKNMIGD